MVHVLHEDGEITVGKIGNAVAANNERRIGGDAAEDFFFAVDLAEDGGLRGGGGDEFEGVNGAVLLVDHFVDRTAIAPAKDGEFGIVGEGERSGGGGGGGGGGCGGRGGRGRQREREGRAALGGFRQGEAEVYLAALPD